MKIGQKHTEASRMKMSASLKGRVTWNKGKKTGIAPWLGKKRSEEDKKKMSLARMGKKLSPEHKEKLRLANIGNTYMKGHKKPVGAYSFPKGNKVCLGKKLSEETKRKISSILKVKALRGEKHNWWRGGVSTQNEIIRSSSEYKLWREAVFARDKYTCIWCGDKRKSGHNVILNADHIQEFSIYPELRFAIDNGRTLCKNCHQKRHRGERRKRN